jgi:hypothetical protein
VASVAVEASNQRRATRKVNQMERTQRQAPAPAVTFAVGPKKW